MMATTSTIAYHENYLSDLFKRVWMGEFVRLEHSMADGPTRIRLRAAHRWLRAEWLAGPKGYLP